jgi:hypothetical protein
VSDLKHSKFGVITLLLFGMVIFTTGMVCGDPVVPAVPETQSLVTGTTADVVGLATETDAGAWTLTNDPPRGPDSVTYTPGGSWEYVTSSGVTTQTNAQDILNDMLDQIHSLGGTATGQLVDQTPFWSAAITQVTIPASNLNTFLNSIIPDSGGSLWQNEINLHSCLATNNHGSSGGIHTGALDPGQVQYTTAYDANIVAQAGHTSFVKSMNIDTRNKVIGQSNIDAKTALTYIATADGGNVVGSENIMLDGAGNSTTAADKMLCPFASAGGNVIPAYCNIIQAGSKFDLTVGSVTTNANERFVGTDATNPVVLNYDINVKPYTASGTQNPATGSAMAYIKAHIQEGNNFNTTKAEDLTYSETSSANGYIYSFNKVIAYQSGKSLL